MTPEAISAIRDLLTTIIGGATVAFIAFSPIGRAVAHRIKHGRVPEGGALPDAGRMDDLSDEVAAMRHQLQETQERLDFAERLLARAREPGALPSPRDAR